MLGPKRAIRAMVHEKANDPLASVEHEEAHKTASEFVNPTLVMSPYPTISGKLHVMQDGPCSKQKYNAAKQCPTCITTHEDTECLFTAIRTFIVNAGCALDITSSTPYFFASSSAPNPPMNFNLHFNRAIKPVDEDVMCRVATKALLPIMQNELAHSRKDRIVRKPMDCSVRHTCDFCLASIFIGSWVCGECGQDYCFDCFKAIEAMLPGICRPLHATKPSDAMATDSDTRDNHSGSMSTLVVDDYCNLAASVLVNKGTICDPSTRRLLSCANGRLHNVDFMIPFTTHQDGHLLSMVQAMTSLNSIATLNEQGPSSQLLGPEHKSREKGGLPYNTFNEQELSMDEFQRVWQEGQIVVVDGLEKKLQIEWSPKAFSAAFPTTKCKVLDCQTASTRWMTIPEFFDDFGKEKSKKSIPWKLKVSSNVTPF